MLLLSPPIQAVAMLVELIEPPVGFLYLPFAILFLRKDGHPIGRELVCPETTLTGIEDEPHQAITALLFFEAPPALVPDVSRLGTAFGHHRLPTLEMMQAIHLLARGLAEVRRQRPGDSEVPS